MKHRQKTNPIIRSLIESFRRLSYENDAKIWKDLAERLSKGTRRMAEVNVGSISLHTEPNELVAVPGKILGAGHIDHPVVVAGVNFSAKARKRITDAGGECISLTDLVERNPEGSNIRIIA